MAGELSEERQTEVDAMQETANEILRIIAARHPESVSSSTTALIMAVAKMGIFLHESRGAPFRQFRRNVDSALVQLIGDYEQQRAAQALEAQRLQRAERAKGQN